MDSGMVGQAERGRVCLIVPCYNEARRLKIEEFSDFVPEHRHVRFLFVNDGSKDDTLELLKMLHERDPEHLTYLDLKQNQGKAEAVRQGMVFAVGEFKPEFVGFWDADLATPLDAIPDFLAQFEKQPSLEMVFGTRISLLGRHVRRKLARHYLGRVFASAVSVALHLPVYDTQCGAKIFRVTPRLNEILAERFLSRWIFDVEIIARVIRSFGGNREMVGEIIFELPLLCWEDVPGSKLHPFDFFRAVREIYAIRRKYL